MQEEMFSFPPFEVKVTYDIDKLKSTINVLPSRKPITVNALAADFAADPAAALLFFITAYSEHPDSATLYCLNLQTGEPKWRVHDVPPGGGIDVSPSNRTVRAGKPYGTNDDFIVMVNYEGEVTQRNPRSGYEMLTLAEAYLKTGKEGFATTLLERALTTNISEYTKAKVYKYLGQIGEQAGRNSDAISYYERALQLNPRESVKRRLAKLRNT